MSVNDQTPNEPNAEEGKKDEHEAEIIPLQRCPHLYIKHTAAKGTASTPPFHHIKSTSLLPLLWVHRIRHFLSPMRRKRIHIQPQSTTRTVNELIQVRSKLTNRFVKHRPRRLLVCPLASLHNPRHLARLTSLPSGKHTTHRQNRTLPLHLQLASSDFQQSPSPKPRTQ